MDIFDAANILYVPGRMTLERLHEVMREAEDKRLDEPEESEEGEVWHSCSCGDRCRC